MGQFNCETCEAKLECIVCKKKLCHTHEDSLPEGLRKVEGHFLMEEGRVCVDCLDRRNRKPSSGWPGW